MNPDPNQSNTPPIPTVETENTPPAPPPPPPVNDPPVQSVSTPPPPPPPGITAQPKVKWGKGQIIGAVVVVVVLIAGLAAGLFLSQRQQNVVPSPAAVCSPVGAQERYCDTSSGSEVDSCHSCGTDNQWAAGCASVPNCNPCGNPSDPNDNTTCNFNPTPTGGPPMCPNNSSLPIANYVKFTCPNGCTLTTEEGVTAWRCYENRQDSSTQLNLNGVCGQVDALSGSTDDTFCGYTEYTCGEARCQNSSNPTPTPAPSTPACVSSTISAGSINPTQSVTLTSTSNVNANTFAYALYNVDNPYPPPPTNNSKPICVTTGGDDTSQTSQCPAGSHVLIYRDPNTAARTNGTRTLTYAQLFVADQNNGGAVATRVQINSYFGVTGGGSSSAHSNCVEYVSAAGVPTLAPTPTPLPTATPPPGATLTPIPTPTPPPSPLAQCQQVTVTNIARGGTAVSSPTLAKIQKGDVVTFRGFATATNATVTSIDFVLTKGGVAQAAVQATPTLVSGVYRADYVITIDQATSYAISSSPTYH